MARGGLRPGVPGLPDRAGLDKVLVRGEPGGDLFLSWNEAPGARNQLVSQAELRRLCHLTEAVSLAEMRGEGPAIVQTRMALSTALFELLDGPDRALGQRIAQAETERRRLDLVVRAKTADRRTLGEHPATWMRWELLPFAETSRRGAPGDSRTSPPQPERTPRSSRRRSASARAIR